MAPEVRYTSKDFNQKYEIPQETQETLKLPESQRLLILKDPKEKQVSGACQEKKRTFRVQESEVLGKDRAIPTQTEGLALNSYSEGPCYKGKPDKYSAASNESDVLIGKRHLEDDTPENESFKAPSDGGRKAKWMVNRNVFLTSLAYLLLCECYFGINILQSTVFGAVGAIGMGVLCIASAVACVSIAPITTSTFGVKRTMLVSVSLLLPWMAAHFYVRIYTIVPTAVISGLAQAPYWTAPATFFTALGMKYSEVTGENEEAVIARFFGSFFCFVLFGASLGCGLTSVILSSSIGDPRGSISADCNMTAPSWPVGLLPRCGKGYCPGVIDEMMMAIAPAVINGTNNTRSDMDESQTGLHTKLMVLVGTHVGAAVLGLFLLFLTDDLPRPEKKPILPALKAVAKKMFKQVRRNRQLLMTPINIYVGLSLGFLMAEVSEAFVACPLGVEMVGYALMTWGIGACVASIVSGFVITYTGRMPVFTFCGVTRLSLTIFLTYWTVDNRHTWVFFFIPSAWAVGDGILQAQVHAMFGYMFHDESESTFAIYRLYEAVGLLVGFFANSQFCLIPKLYFMLTLQIFSWISYYLTELLQRRMENKQKEGKKSEKIIAVNDSARHEL